jgi:cell division septation protein DedD
MALKKRILYFIAGIAPTEAEERAALSLGTTIFRNAQSYYDGDFVEPCDGVAGCAPEAYLKKFPKVDEKKLKEPKSDSKPAPVVAQPSPPPPPPPPPATGGTTSTPWSNP